MNPKVKQDGDDEEVTEEATEETTEEATEETAEEEAPAEGGEAGDAEEKALLTKIKSVVKETVDEKFTAFKKNQPLVFAQPSKNNIQKKAMDLMTNAQKKRFDGLGKAAQKKFAEDVIIAKYLQAQYLHDYKMVKDLSEGTDSEGGYLVPSPLSNRIYEIITAIGHARREMTVLPMSSMTLDLSTLATKPTVAWISEGAQITASDLAFGRKTLTAEKLAGITAMSNEVLADANVDLVNYNIQKFAEAIADSEDEAFFNTCSASGVTGILQDTTNTVTMGSGDTSFADMAYTDLVDVIYTLGAKQRQGAKWCFSSYITSLVMKLLDSQNRPIWSRATEGEPAYLLGYPIIENDQMPESGDDAVSTEFLAFGNFKEYIIGDRQAMTSTILREGTVGSTNLAEKDSSGLRVVERVSGIAPTPLAFVTLKTAAS